MSNQRPPATPTKKKKLDVSTIVIVCIIVVILIAAGIFAIHSLTTPLAPVTTTITQPTTSGGPAATPTTTTTTATLPADAATDTPIANAAVGTCFERQATIDSKGAYVDPIDCGQPHDSELFYSANVTDTSYPDSAGWQQNVLDSCHPAFKTYTGITFGQNSWQIYYIYPSQQAWDNGSRLLICYTTDPLDGRTTSVKAAS